MVSVLGSVLCWFSHNQKLKVMTDASVIIPVCASNPATLFMTLVAIRTCAASTDAPILVLCNNTPEGEYRDTVFKNCQQLGVVMHYIDGPFSISKCYNLATGYTSRKYIAYGTADVIYYPGWLDTVIELWEQDPSYFALSTYSFDVVDNPCSRNLVATEKKIIETHHPSAGVLVLKRESNYIWDEQFELWEIDSDFWYYLKANNLKAGYCLGARCDHMIGGVRPHIDIGANFGFKDDPEREMYKDPRKRLEKKWNLPPYQVP